MRGIALPLLIGANLIFGCKTAAPEVDTTSTTSAAAGQPAMTYVNLCDRQNHCKKFSRLIMGTDHLAQSNWTKDGQSEPTDEQVFEVLDEAVRLGINFFDTSPIYVGDIENRVGKWLKSRRQVPSPNPDKKLYVLSKGGFPFDLFYSKKLDPGTHSNALKSKLLSLGILDSSATQLPDGSTPLTNVPPGTYASRLFGNEQQIKNRVAEELGHTKNNLNDDLTIYLMHRDDGDYVKFDEVPRDKTPVKSIMSALSDKALASKYWLIGWSNWQTDRVNESIKLAAANPSLARPALNSAYFSLFEMSSRSIHAGGVQATHKEMMDPSFQKGIMQSPYSPLGGFSVLDKPEPRWENAKKAAKLKYDAGDPYWQNVFPSIFTDANQARYARAVQFTASFNKKHRTTYAVDQTINAYALAHKRTDFLTVGPITVAELRRTVGALKMSQMLTAQDLEYLYRGN